MVPPMLLRSCDVPVLGALVAAAQQDHECIPLAAEVHAIAWSEMDAKLLHAVAHAACVTEVADTDSGDALADAVARPSIPESSEPFG